MTGPRVLHVTLSASLRASGVATYVWKLTKALHEAGAKNAVATLAEEGLERDACEHLGHADLIAGSSYPTRALGVAPGLWRRLSREMARADVVHIHGLRNSLVWWAAARARRMRKPLIISPHGQLHPWLLNQRRSRKAVMDTLFTRRDLRRTSRVHAVSEAEAGDIRKYVPGVPVTAVTIGIDPGPYIKEQDALTIEAQWPQVRGRRVLLYCSLLSPRKGLPMLAAAWSRLAPRFPDWHLVVAGVDAEGYLATVQQDFAGAVEDGSASLIGQVTEQEKVGLLQRAEAFVLPTLSEAFAIVVLESLASGTPLLTTTGAPWPQLPERGCGWWVEPTADQIAEGLNEAMSLSDADRAAMGERGRAMVEAQYTWGACVQKMLAMYHEVIEGSGRPA